MIYALLYAILTGIYNVFKKKSVKQTNEHAVLLLFTATAFLCSLIWIPFNISIPIKFVWIFALKGIVIAINWFIVLKVLKHADISLVSLTVVLSTVLNFVFGIFVFDEDITLIQTFGVIIVITGAVLINYINKTEKGEINIKQILMLIISAIY